MHEIFRMDAIVFSNMRCQLSLPLFILANNNLVRIELAIASCNL